MGRGYVMRDELPTGSSPTPNRLVFNLGRRDASRHARALTGISLAFNFEWTNETLQNGAVQAARVLHARQPDCKPNGPPEGFWIGT